MEKGFSDTSLQSLALLKLLKKWQSLKSKSFVFQCLQKNHHAEGINIFVTCLEICDTGFQNLQCALLCNSMLYLQLCISGITIEGYRCLQIFISFNDYCYFISAQWCIYVQVLHIFTSMPQQKRYFLENLFWINYLGK